MVGAIERHAVHPTGLLTKKKRITIRKKQQIETLPYHVRDAEKHLSMLNSGIVTHLKRHLTNVQPNSIADVNVKNLGAVAGLFLPGHEPRRGEAGHKDDGSIAALLTNRRRRWRSRCVRRSS